ncbi:hypothetical protein KY362_03730 [Candidatus Woesearchaeota archaeon]|nr:hypothetical protein [Candidatus Woesearchaeota archaeon]
MDRNGEIIPVHVCRYRQGEDAEYMIVFGGCKAVEVRAMGAMSAEARKERYERLHDRKHLIIFSVQDGAPGYRVTPSSSDFWDVAQEYFDSGIKGKDTRFEVIPSELPSSIEDLFE